MNRFVALLLTALVAFHGAVAFTTPAHPAALAVRTSQSLSGSSPFQPQSSTSLNLKVKVDPEAAKSKRTNPAAFKNAAYGGSIAIAVALPLIFLVWSALK